MREETNDHVAKACRLCLQAGYQLEIGSNLRISRSTTARVKRRFTIDSIARSLKNDAAGSEKPLQSPYLEAKMRVCRAGIVAPGPLVGCPSMSSVSGPDGSELIVRSVSPRLIATYTVSPDVTRE